MNWKIIDKSGTKQPGKGTYSAWKKVLADEGSNQCVYCGTKDHRLGGIRHFHVEHYKPKSVFPLLINNIYNLYYACPICNIFKSNDWYKVTGNLNDVFYPEPSKFNYRDLFELDTGGKITSRSRCGNYLISKLGLNRRQLVLDRQFTMLLSGYATLKEEYRGIRDSLMRENSNESRAMLMKLWSAYDKVIDQKDQMFENAPYSIDDTKRNTGGN